MGFAGYFLIVWDFIRYARTNGIPVGPGRGSAAGSARLLRPRDHRHRSAPVRPALRALPEPRAHQHAGHRHRLLHAPPAARSSTTSPRSTARDRVAQIITFGTLAARAVIRDVGRVLGMPYAEVDRIAKLVPDMTKSLAQAVEESRALAQRDGVRPRGQRSDRRRQPPRGADPPRLDPRRRRRDHAAPSGRPGPALQDHRATKSRSRPSGT